MLRIIIIQLCLRVNLLDNNFEKSILTSLSAGDNELFSYLDYILQDLWHLGCDAEPLLNLIQKNVKTTSPDFSVLDLCCGKGATLFKLVNKLGIKGTGIDLYEPFIKTALKKTTEEHLENKLHFQVMDIHDALLKYNGYDLVLFGEDVEIGSDTKETIQKLSGCIKDNGYILYESITSDFKETSENFQSFCDIIDHFVYTREDLKSYNEINNLHIKKRTDELIEKYPEKKDIFDKYVNSQIEESALLENDMLVFILLLKKRINTE